MALITIVSGNLLDAEENLIVHQVNCQGVMGSGIALQVKKKWYNVYQEYKAVCDVNLSVELLGNAQPVRVGANQSVVNLFGQKDYGYMGARFTNYEALYSGLEKVASVARQQGLSVAIPYKLGSDRGGADWNIVYAMIESVFKGHKQPVTIYNISNQDIDIPELEDTVQMETQLN